MAIQVPVQNVESQRHLSVLVTHVKDGAPNGQVKMETYSGWIRVNFGSSSLAPEKVVSFLLDEGKKIPTYNGPADLIDYTVSVAPAYVGMSDDFNTSIAVDNAEVKIEEQIIEAKDGTKAKFIVPVLKANVSAMHSDLNTLTYQVTMLTPVPPRDQPQQPQEPLPTAVPQDKL